MLTRNIYYRVDIVKQNTGAPYVPVVNDSRFYNDASNDAKAAFKRAQNLAHGLQESYMSRGIRAIVKQETPAGSQPASRTSADGKSADVASLLNGSQP